MKRCGGVFTVTTHQSSTLPRQDEQKPWTSSAFTPLRWNQRGMKICDLHSLPFEIRFNEEIKDEASAHSTLGLLVVDRNHAAKKREDLREGHTHKRPSPLPLSAPPTFRQKQRQQSKAHTIVQRPHTGPAPRPQRGADVTATVQK